MLDECLSGDRAATARLHTSMAAQPSSLRESVKASHLRIITTPSCSAASSTSPNTPVETFTTGLEDSDYDEFCATFSKVKRNGHAYGEKLSTDVASLGSSSPAHATALELHPPLAVQDGHGGVDSAVERAIEPLKILKRTNTARDHGYQVATPELAAPLARPATRAASSLTFENLQTSETERDNSYVFSARARNSDWHPCSSTRGHPTSPLPDSGHAEASIGQEIDETAQRRKRKPQQPIVHQTEQPASHVCDDTHTDSSQRGQEAMVQSTDLSASGLPPSGKRRRSSPPQHRCEVSERAVAEAAQEALCGARPSNQASRAEARTNVASNPPRLASRRLPPHVSQKTLPHRFTELPDSPTGTSDAQDDGRPAAGLDAPAEHSVATSASTPRPRRQYICRICGEKRNTQSNLNDHLDTHRDDRDFVCADCGKGFKQNCQLNRHAKIHDRKSHQYWCRSCPMTFAQKIQLQVHLRRARFQNQCLSVWRNSGIDAQVLSSLLQARDDMAL